MVRATKDVDAAVAMDAVNLSRLALLVDGWQAIDMKRIDGVEAPVCSFADLVAMKRSTGRGADELDLVRLREARGALPGDRPRS